MPPSHAAPILVGKSLRQAQTERPAKLRADRIPSCSSTPPASCTSEAPRTPGSVTSTLQRGVISILRLQLTSNLDKITEHGRRADNIVKSMLEHSRGVSGERREVDLNALIEEALNLAYHGARAQDQSFNITLECDFQPGLAPIEVAPQEMTRVFVNLFNNGF